VLAVVVVDLDGVLRRWDPGVLAGAEAAFGLPAGALGEVAFAPALLSAAVTGGSATPCGGSRWWSRWPGGSGGPPGWRTDRMTPSTTTPPDICHPSPVDTC